MRIRHYLLACLIITSSSNAFARGGPNGVFTSILEDLLVLAVIIGLFGGALCACFLCRMPWKSLAFLSIVGVAFGMIPFVGFLLITPMFVLLTVFVAVFYLLQSGLFQVHIVEPSLTPTDGEPQKLETTGISKVIHWIAGTYVFWVVVSLANFKLLGFLAIPLVGLFLIGKFLPFILPPLVVALIIGTIITVLAVKILRTNQYMAPLIFNVCVLLAFFTSAEFFRHQLMSESLLNHKPNHFNSSSFSSSVFSYRPYGRGSHASFDENGKTYRWSYSERKFFQVTP